MLTETYSETVKIEPKTRVLLMALRQALIIAIGALEDYLCIQRSIVPKHERK